MGWRVLGRYLFASESLTRKGVAAVRTLCPARKFDGAIHHIQLIASNLKQEFKGEKRIGGDVRQWVA